MSKAEKNTVASGDAEELVPRNGVTSIVWTCFGQVICKECNKVVSSPQSNTTNLFNHLKKHHKPKYEECMKAKANVNSQNPCPCPAPTQTTITATLHWAVPYPSTSQRRAEITDAITFYLAKRVRSIQWAMKASEKWLKHWTRNTRSPLAIISLKWRCLRSSLKPKNVDRLLFLAKNL